MDITCAKNVFKLKGKKGVVTADLGALVEIASSANKEAFKIEAPGEYEVEGISVFAYPAGESLAALIQIEEIKVLTIAGILSDALIEEMDVVDVVILDTRAVPSKDLVAMIGKIEPSYVIPAGESAGIASFVKDFEHTSRTVEKLTLNKATLATDITDVVVLST